MALQLLMFVILCYSCFAVVREWVPRARASHNGSVCCRDWKLRGLRLTSDAHVCVLYAHIIITGCRCQELAAWVLPSDKKTPCGAPSWGFNPDLLAPHIVSAPHRAQSLFSFVHAMCIFHFYIEWTRTRVALEKLFCSATMPDLDCGGDLDL